MHHIIFSAILVSYIIGPEIYYHNYKLSYWTRNVIQLKFIVTGRIFLQSKSAQGKIFNLIQIFSNPNIALWHKCSIHPKFWKCLFYMCCSFPYRQLIKEFYTTFKTASNSFHVNRMTLSMRMMYSSCIQSFIFSLPASTAALWNSTASSRRMSCDAA